MISFVRGDFLCALQHWLQFGSGFFAVLAAITWFLASRAKIPNPIAWNNIDAFSAGAVKQSRLNALAAIFAAVAALLQVPQAFMPTCWG
jgi:hypothetical protein